MKRIFAMFVVLVMLSTLCACEASPPETEDKEKICAALTDIQDWDEADALMDETVSLYRDEKALQYTPHGVYNLSDEEVKVYTFESPNDFYEVATFNGGEDFIIVIHNTGHHGISFWSGIRKGATFYGLTQNYILYQEGDSIIAVSILEREDCQVGEYMYEVLPFDELTEKEQATAIYPKDSYIKQF